MEEDQSFVKLQEESDRGSRCCAWSDILGFSLDAGSNTLYVNFRSCGSRPYEFATHDRAYAAGCLLRDRCDVTTKNIDRAVHVIAEKRKKAQLEEDGK